MLLGKGMVFPLAPSDLSAQQKLINFQKFDYPTEQCLLPSNLQYLS